MKKADLALYKRENPCYNLFCSGPVVQSVSTPACHAGGRRFESVPGRQKRGTILWMVPLFWANRGGLERLNPPLLWRGGQRVRAPLPPYGLPCSPQRVPSGSPCLLIQQNVYNHRERNTTRAHRKRGMPWFFLPFTAAPEFPSWDLRQWTFLPPGRSGKPAAWECWQSGRKRQAPLPRPR